MKFAQYQSESGDSWHTERTTVHQPTYFSCCHIIKMSCMSRFALSFDS
uniref:Uncharacterized protein n=1 Tax=Lepeophtheirus salmonis TaxID=72036 RepID=A0A0K2T4A8_LEPSM